MFGYAYEELIGQRPITLIQSDSYPVFTGYLRTIQTEGQFQTRAIALHKDGTAFPIEVHGNPFIYKSKLYGLTVIWDITEQVQAYQLLEQRVQERTRELSTLLEVSHNVAFILELKPLLGVILDQLKTVADYTGCSISTVQDEDLVIVDNRGPAPVEQALQVHIPIKRLGPLREILNRSEPIIIADVRDDTLLAQAFRQWLGKHLETTFSYIRSWMAIPLTHKERL